jgi:hypothetical protein
MALRQANHGYIMPERNNKLDNIRRADRCPAASAAVARRSFFGVLYLLWSGIGLAQK